MIRRYDELSKIYLMSCADNKLLLDIGRALLENVNFNRNR